MPKLKACHDAFGVETVSLAQYIAELQYIRKIVERAKDGATVYTWVEQKIRRIKAWPMRCRLSVSFVPHVCGDSYDKTALMKLL